MLGLYLYITKWVANVLEVASVQITQVPPQAPSRAAKKQLLFASFGKPTRLIVCASHAVMPQLMLWFEARLPTSPNLHVHFSYPTSCALEVLSRKHLAATHGLHMGCHWLHQPHVQSEPGIQTFDIGQN